MDSNFSKCSVINKYNLHNQACVNLKCLIYIFIKIHRQHWARHLHATSIFSSLRIDVTSCKKSAYVTTFIVIEIYHCSFYKRRLNFIASRNGWIFFACDAYLISKKWYCSYSSLQRQFQKQCQTPLISNDMNNYSTTRVRV